MEFQTLHTVDHGAVRLLSLNRPDKKNSVDLQMAEELWLALEEAGRNDGVRAVVLAGAGDDFCAGVDVNIFLDTEIRSEEPSPELVRLSHVDRAFREFAKPLLAAVQGRAVGMGVTLLPHFDVVYAAEDASFITPFVKLGLVLEYGSSFTLPRLIGRQRANEMILRAAPIDAATALGWGLVARVFPRAALLQEVLAIAGEIAAHPPGAVSASKRLLRQGEQSDFLTADSSERRDLAKCYGSPENVAAVQAFLASRAKGG